MVDLHEGEHRSVMANGALFHVVEFGCRDGPPVLLLHGFPDFWWGWRQVIPPMSARRHRVVAVDMRGFAESEPTERLNCYSLDSLERDVVGIADALGLGRLVLVGHDWGGVVAWTVAARRPERVRRLVAVAAPHPDVMGRSIRRDPRQLARSLYIAFFQLPWLPEAMLSAGRFRLLRRALVGSSDPGTFSEWELERYVDAWRGPRRLHSMLNYYRALRVHQGEVGRVTVPTNVVWRGHDRFLDSTLGEASVAMCDHGRFVEQADASRWLPLERPGIIADLVSPG
jgi:epoxide hydrolase 4